MVASQESVLDFFGLCSGSPKKDLPGSFEYIRIPSIFFRVFLVTDDECELFIRISQPTILLINLVPGNPF